MERIALRAVARNALRHSRVGAAPSLSTTMTLSLSQRRGVRTQAHQHHTWTRRAAPTLSLSNTAAAAATTPLLQTRTFSETAPAHDAKIIDKKDGEKKPEEKKPEKKEKKKMGIWSQAKDVVLHIYHGFRLLTANTKVAVKLQNRVLKGNELTRRERQLLERTTKDLIRMVPFSLFIIIPGGELLLPVALVIFPDLTPSTFNTRASVRKKEIMANLQKGVRGRRVFEHTFARVIIDEGYDLYSSSWGILKRVGQGDVVTENDIRSMAHHFQTGHKLDMRNVPSYILRDMARVLGVYHWFGGSFLPRRLYDARLRSAISEYWEQMETDDSNLLATGIDTLTDQELEHECMKRNMRWFAKPRALRYQLTQWCNLTQAPDIPSHVLGFIKPCATSHRQVQEGLSKEEIDHVLGTSKYEDAPMKNMLLKLRNTVKKEAVVKDDSILEEDVDDLRNRVDEVRNEDLAVEEALVHVRRALLEFDNPTLIKIYEACVSKEGEMRACDSEVGVDVVTLCHFLMDKFKEKDPGLSLSTYRLILCMREFDIDSSDLISRDEFLRFVSRLKSNE